MKARGFLMGLMVASLVGCDQGRETPPVKIDVGDGSEVSDPVVEPGDDAGSEPGEWVSMVPGEGMGNWELVDYGGEGKVSWNEGVLRMEWGEGLTGVRWTGDLPKVPYEIELEARKTLGDDFFCGLTVPVGQEDACVTLIVGGWGGGVVGISSVDDLDASSNETSSWRDFVEGDWYKIRMIIREDKLEAWVGEEKMVDLETKNRRLSLREGAIEDSAPLGVSAWQTESEARGIRWRKLP